jgi:hypothetical protein
LTHFGILTFIKLYQYSLFCLIIYFFFNRLQLAKLTSKSLLLQIQVLTHPQFEGAILEMLRLRRKSERKNVLMIFARNVKHIKYNIFLSVFFSFPFHPVAKQNCCLFRHPYICTHVHRRDVTTAMSQIIF